MSSSRHMSVDPCLGEPAPAILLKLNGLQSPPPDYGDDDLTPATQVVYYRHLTWYVSVRKYAKWEEPLKVTMTGEMTDVEGKIDYDAKWCCRFSWTLRILSQAESGRLVLWQKDAEEDASLIPSCDWLEIELMSPKELEKKGFLHNRSLLLELTINADFPDTENCPLGERAWKERPLTGSGRVLSPLLASGEDADVTLVSADGKHIRAHKLILKAFSPVFRAMLSHDWEEGKTGIIKIEDINGEALSILVRYIYAFSEGSDAWRKSWLPEAVLHELMNAAEKYEIPRLKNLTAYGLLRKLNRENAYEILGLFMKNDLKGLVSEVCAYIAWINRN